jgi:hypothetical protein
MNQPYFVILQVREGCVAVDTAPFRAAVEAHAAAALAALGRTMHASASRDRDAIAEFAKHSRSVLSSEAASLSELGEARVQVSCTSLLCTTAECTHSFTTTTFCCSIFVPRSFC